MVAAGDDYPERADLPPKHHRKPISTDALRAQATRNLSEIREVSVVFINLKGLKLAQQGANKTVQRGQAHHHHQLGNHHGGTTVARRPSSQKAFF